jgi:hypothetical protein
MKNIKDYLPYYIGCDIQITEPSGFGESVFIEKLISITDVTAGTNKFDYYFDGDNEIEFKPIIRKLSSMTEEDIDFSELIPNYKVAFNHFTGGYNVVIEDEDSCDGFVVTIYPDGSMNCLCKDNREEYPFEGGELFRKLLSKGFWLFGDNWFEEGLIIEKK